MHNPRPLFTRAERPAQLARVVCDARRPKDRRPDGEFDMRAGIHPVYELRTFHCYGCGTEWQTRTTIEPHTSDGKIHLDICSNCHPFFTGKQKLIDKAGRVERYRRRYSKKDGALATTCGSTRAGVAEMSSGSTDQPGNWWRLVPM